MVKINIRKKLTDDWTPFDFVVYFKSKYEVYYRDQFKINPEKDSILMGRVLKVFNKMDKPKSLVLKFIDWVFEKQKNNYDTNRLSVGFLPYLIQEYISDFKTAKRGG